MHRRDRGRAIRNWLAGLVVVVAVTAGTAAGAAPPATTVPSTTSVAPSTTTTPAPPAGTTPRSTLPPSTTTTPKADRPVAPPGPDAAPAGASSGVTTRYTLDVRGGYVAAGTGLRNLGRGSIVISGIPSGSVVRVAYLYWTVFATSESPTFANGVINRNVLTGTRVGTGPAPNWSRTNMNGYAYRADVTRFVGGNGTYNLSEFTSGSTAGGDPASAAVVAPLLNGASLVVVYDKVTVGTYPLTRVVINDGYAAVGTNLPNAMPPSASTGFNWTTPASNPVGQVRTTFIVGDGQSNLAESAPTFNGSPVQVGGWRGADRQVVPNYTIGNLWDTTTHTVGSFVRPGDTSATVTVSGGADVVTWVGQILSIGLNGAADTDGDALLDGWEYNGYDADGDRIVDVDLPALGADPLRKDIFVEMDYMQASNIPATADLDRIRAVFANSPDANNPNGQAGINIHLDAGNTRGATYNLGGGNLVPFDSNLSPYESEIVAIRNANFASARRKIFHYMIWAENYAGGTSSGISLGIPSDTFVVTLGGWTSHGTANERVGTFIHELGHNLNLRHGGSDDVNYKPNFLSVMNYYFQMSGVPRTGGLAADYGYSPFLLPNLNESSLNETVGLNSALATSYRTRWYCPNGTQVLSPGTANGFLDWNCNAFGSGTVAVDVNGSGGRSTLTGKKEWGNLTFDGGNVGAGSEQGFETLPSAMAPELTFEENQRIQKGGR